MKEEMIVLVKRKGGGEGEVVISIKMNQVSETWACSNGIASLFILFFQPVPTAH